MVRIFLNLEQTIVVGHACDRHRFGSGIASTLPPCHCECAHKREQMFYSTEPVHVGCSRGFIAF